MKPLNNGAPCVVKLVDGTEVLCRLLEDEDRDPWMEYPMVRSRSVRGLTVQFERWVELGDSSLVPVPMGHVLVMELANAAAAERFEEWAAMVYPAKEGLGGA